MAGNYQEIEAKFLVTRLRDLQERLVDLHSALVEPRIHELNLRFDDNQGTLTETGQVLRLRRDARIHLTYKDAGQAQAGVIERREVEVEIGDFQAAHDLLVSLGFRVIFIYEKYRTTYSFDRVHVMLDELPYGDFAEIEGEAAAIQEAARRLELNCSRAVLGSYHSLFESMRRERALPFRDLTFENFSGLTASPEDLGILPADAGGNPRSASPSGGIHSG